LGRLLVTVEHLIRDLSFCSHPAHRLLLAAHFYTCAFKDFVCCDLKNAAHDGHFKMLLETVQGQIADRAFTTMIPKVETRQKTMGSLSTSCLVFQRPSGSVYARSRRPTAALPTVPLCAISLMQECSRCCCNGCFFAIKPVVRIVSPKCCVPVYAEGIV